MTRTFDVVVVTPRGDLKATFNAEEGIPTGLLIQAVMSHQQLFPHLLQLNANAATTLLITTPNRLELPPGFSIVFSDGVNINGPLHPSPIPNVPHEFNGVQLTSGLRAVVTYKVDLDYQHKFDAALSNERAKEAAFRAEPPDIEEDYDY
jgi:hypothetical protein